VSIALEALLLPVVAREDLVMEAVVVQVSSLSSITPI
jgi:hypothetical protein